ncbi:MAG: MCE family protein [Proteobacteria bacterium]|nr:MCE family protein [Pseudomonadota bacterium]
MKRDNINYLMVGSFVLAMGVALVVLLFAVTGRSGPTDTYYVVYDNVAGLNFGTGVFFEGYRIGQVEAISPEPQAAGMRYRLELSVRSGWKIPSDSVATVAASGLISAVTIDIHQGQAATALRPGDVIDGRAQTDLFSVLNQAAGDFRVLSQEGLMPVLKNLDTRISTVTDEIVKFRHDDLTPLVTMLHERLDKEVLGGTISIIKQLDESARGLTSMFGAANQAHVKDILTHVDGVAVNLNELVTRVETSRAQADKLLVALDQLVADNRGGVDASVNSAQVSMRELQRALKTVNEHLAQILVNLEGGSRNMNEFARTIRGNPGRLLRNAETSEPGQQ